MKSNYKHLAKQGSHEWLMGRKTRFGGSEIGTVIKGKVKTIIKQKKKLEEGFKTNLYCWWGHTFEGVGKSWLTYSNKWEIHEFGSIPSSQWPVAYSPDGVFINKDLDLWLLEIKCPFLRNVDQNATIKTEYMDQIQIGMRILPCSKTAFIQFKFRKCWGYQIHKQGKYNRGFHKEQKRSKEQKEIFYGALYWNTAHFIEEEELMTKPDKIYLSFECDVVDIVESYNNGNYMYFKCFYIKSECVPIDPTWNKHKEIIWKGYEKLIDSTASS